MITRKKIMSLVSLFALLILPTFGCSVFMADNSQVRRMLICLKLVHQEACFWRNLAHLL